MESSLLGVEGYDEASELGSKVGFLVYFLLGGPGFDMISMEGGLLRSSQGPHGCLGGVYPPSLLDYYG